MEIEMVVVCGAGLAGCVALHDDAVRLEFALRAKKESITRIGYTWRIEGICASFRSNNTLNLSRD